MSLIQIRPMAKNDIKTIVAGFNQVGWNKPSSLFHGYFNEIENGQRIVFLAFYQNLFSGYVTLFFHSKYLPFKDQSIPEIADLNVLPTFRNRGIGSLLLDHAEKAAKMRGQAVGIGVGLYAGKDGGYGPAQRLYVKRGYIPDGRGVTYRYEPVIPGRSYPFDDDLVLWLIKKFL